MEECGKNRRTRSREEYSASIAPQFDAWGDWRKAAVPKSERACAGMRVLHVANTQFFIETLMAGKLHGLQEAGVVVYTAAASSASGVMCPFSFFPAEIPRSLRPFRLAKALVQLVRLMRKLKPDLVHTHSSVAGFVGRMAARIAGIPCMHTVHGLPFYDSQRPLFFRFSLAMERFAARQSVAVLSQNRENMLTMRKAHFAAPLRFEGNGIDIEAVEAAADRAAVRDELGLQPEQVAFAFFARWEPVKGHFVFLRAFEKLCAENGNAVAVLAGENLGLGGRYAKRLQRAIENSPARDRIVLLGFRKDVHRLLSGCDALVLPSRKEGVPRIVMEAMALGLPVVATDAPGTREIVAHGRSGLLSPVGDAEGLAINMEILLEWPEARHELGRAGRSILRSQYRESQVIARILAAYDQVQSELLDRGAAVESS